MSNKTHDLVCLTNILTLLDDVQEYITDGEGKFDYELLNTAAKELERRVLSSICEITEEK